MRLYYSSVNDYIHPAMRTLLKTANAVHEPTTYRERAWALDHRVVNYPQPLYYHSAESLPPPAPNRRLFDDSVPALVHFLVYRVTLEVLRPPPGISFFLAQSCRRLRWSRLLSIWSATASSCAQEGAWPKRSWQEVMAGYGINKTSYAFEQAWALAKTQAEHARRTAMACIGSTPSVKRRPYPLYSS